MDMDVFISNKKPKIILIIQYFEVQNTDFIYKSLRQKEIIECLKRNVKNPLIDEIHMINEKLYTFDFIEASLNHKIKQIIMNKRLTYKMAIDYYNKYIPDTICILSNADIFMDESLELLHHIHFDNTVLALNRYEYDSDDIYKANMLGGVCDNLRNRHGCNYLESFQPSIWTQDTWIWKMKHFHVKDINFKLGIPGCDNNFIFLLDKQGYNVYNPSRLLSINHYDRLSTIYDNHGTYKGSFSQKRENRIGDLNSYMFVENSDDIFDKYTVSCKKKPSNYPFICGYEFKKDISEIIQIPKASSFLNGYEPISKAWQPDPNDKECYLEYTFKELTDIYILDILGKSVDKDNKESGFVTSFKIQYLTKDNQWVYYKDILKGIHTKHGNFIKRIYLEDPIKCLKLKLCSFTFSGIPALKVRMFGKINETIPLISSYQPICSRSYLISIMKYHNPNNYTDSICDKINKYKDCYVYDEYNKYKIILANSKFSLCPVTNSIRFGEILSHGTIPVIFSNTDTLPQIHGWNWDECIIFWKESEIDSLYNYLYNFDLRKMEYMSHNCIDVYNKYFSQNQEYPLIQQSPTISKLSYFLEKDVFSSCEHFIYDHSCKNVINIIFPHIYIISLFEDSTKTRRTHTKSTLRMLGANFTFCYMNRPSKEVYDEYLQLYNTFSDDEKRSPKSWEDNYICAKLKQSEIGIIASHAWILGNLTNSIIHNKVSNSSESQLHLILEDDIIAIKDFDNRLLRFLKEYPMYPMTSRLWMLTSLDWKFRVRPNSPMNGYYKPYNTNMIITGAGAYAVNIDYAKELSNQLSTLKKPADDYFIYEFDKHRDIQYGCVMYPPLFLTDFSTSTNDNIMNQESLKRLKDSCFPRLNYDDYNMMRIKYLENPYIINALKTACISNLPMLDALYKELNHYNCEYKEDFLRLIQQISWTRNDFQKFIEDLDSCKV